MTDQMTLELLSRHLDGDLSAAEERDLRQRLASNPTLGAELRSLHELRRSVARFAARERAPAQLDALIGPLLRARPEPPLVRPWVRWLATAAVVVLGLSVIIEVNRRGPPQNASESARRYVGKSRVETSEPFPLAPLPTSSLSADERPLGVSDRLLASPIPAQKIEVDAPPALEVSGPLEKPVGDTLDEDAGVVADTSRQQSGGRVRRASNTARPGVAALG
jgi:hypothetical protein